jgi:hypothetical protein
MTGGGQAVKRLGPPVGIGPAGPQGEQGPQGPSGEPAQEPEFTASAETVGSESVASVEITGQYPDLNLEFRIPRGADGTNGVDGFGTIDVGQTETLSAGSNAYVTNSGTSQNAILNFGIPRGQDGSGGGYGVEEAPYDGQIYGRSSGGWTPITGGGGGGTCECPPPPDLSGYIQDAPQDGYPYVRVNGSWVQLSNYVMTNG